VVSSLHERVERRRVVGSKRRGEEASVLIFPITLLHLTNYVWTSSKAANLPFYQRQLERLAGVAATIYLLSLFDLLIFLNRHNRKDCTDGPDSSTKYHSRDLVEVKRTRGREAEEDKLKSFFAPESTRGRGALQAGCFSRRFGEAEISVRYGRALTTSLLCFTSLPSSISQPPLPVALLAVSCCR